MSDIEELKKLNQRLTKMLEDPQPGLVTWHLMLSRLLMQMADYAGYGMLSEIVKTLPGWRERMKGESECSL